MQDEGFHTSSPLRLRHQLVVVALFVLLLTSGALFVSSNAALHRAGEDVSHLGELRELLSRTATLASRLGHQPLPSAGLLVNPGATGETRHDLERLRLQLGLAPARLASLHDPSLREQGQQEMEPLFQLVLEDLALLTGDEALASVTGRQMAAEARQRLVSVNPDLPLSRLLNALTLARDEAFAPAPSLRFQRGLAICGIMLVIALTALQTVRHHAAPLKQQVRDAERLRKLIGQERDMLTGRHARRQTDLRSIRDRTFW